ncbi:MAG TPA: sodium:proton antiporter, partial [Ohtaekwangia sp.]
VALTCYFFIPGFTWPLAFILGAIVSPPDAVASTSIIRGLGLNKRIITILEGESLVNDASALIAYRFAIAALSTGVFVFWEAGVDFLVVTTGGILTGIAVGYVLSEVHKRILNNSIISTSLTLLTPFMAYLAAEHIHTSGVLAVVSTGLMMSWRAPEMFSFQTRIRNRAVWDTVIFLLNGFIFILIGLQLPLILSELGGYGTGKLIGYGLLVSGVTIAVRILWVFGSAYSPFTRRQIDTWKSVLIVAWTGTRGVVSLATALALPMTLANGSVFPQRSLILFLAFTVIFITLVVQGLSLPVLLKILRVKPLPVYTDEEREIRLLIASSVVNFIDDEFPLMLNEAMKERIKKRYRENMNQLSKELEASAAGVSLKKGVTSTVSDFFAAQAEIIKFQRNLLISFHKEGVYDQATIRRLEQELDLEELQLSKRASKK